MPVYIEIAGRRFGKLVVLKKIGKSGRKEGRQKWLCRCDCGNEKIISKTSLLQGVTNSCGCLFKENALKNFSELTKKGMLTPVRYSRSSYGIFLCDCGNEKEMRIDGFKNGHSVSCGCYGKKISAEARRLSKITHGMSSTRIYKIFRGMKYRCNVKNCPCYGRYGGRGIKVEWESFEQFFVDMGESYESHIALHGAENTSINRIDNNGNYCKENCEWSTRKYQARNRKTSRIIEYNGTQRTLAEWEEITGIPRNVIESRIDRHGWSTEKALTQKVITKKNYGQYQ